MRSSHPHEPTEHMESWLTFVGDKEPHVYSSEDTCKYNFKGLFLFCCTIDTIAIQFQFGVLLFLILPFFLPFLQI